MWYLQIQNIENIEKSLGNSLQDLHLGATPVVISQWLRLGIMSPSVSHRSSDVHPHIYNLTLQAAQLRDQKQSYGLQLYISSAPQPHICFLTYYHPCSFCSIGGSTSDGVSPGRVQPSPLLLVLKRNGDSSRRVLLR